MNILTLAAALKLSKTETEQLIAERVEDIVRETVPEITIGMVVATAAEMTDESKIYVYAGSETGYTHGHWYYHNGTAWTDGGEYTAPIDIDTTLTISGKAADAKKVGDEISNLKENLNNKYARVECGKNLINNQEFILNQRLYSNNIGQKQTYTSNSNTDIIKIEVVSGEKYSGQNIKFYSFVDSSNTLLTTLVNADEDDFTVTAPESAAFIWLQIRHVFIDSVQLEKGESVTPYEEYNPYDSIYVRNEKVIQLPIPDAITPLFKNVIGQYSYASSLSDFPNSYSFNSDGTKNTTTGSHRPSTDYIDISNYGFAEIMYGLSALKDSNNTLNIISFFNEDLEYLDGVASTFSGYASGIVDVPAGTKYVVGTWYDSLTESPYIIGYNSESTNARVSALEGYFPHETVTEVVTPTMSLSQFVTAVESGFDSFASLCRCKRYCFLPIKTSMSWETIYNVLNMNFRKNVCDPSMTHEENCYQINKAFTKPIYRFVDGRLNTSQNIQFSLSTGFQADEPSAIVSEDGQKLYIYAHLKRIETEDGVTWSESTPLVLSGGGSVTYLMHVNINLIDGVYYLIGPKDNSGGSVFLFTSTDGINFDYQGKIFDDFEFTSGYSVKAWGNTYLIKDYGTDKFYLYVESQAEGEPWRIDLVTCTNILYDNGDGTIGNWVASNENPMLYKPIYEYDHRYQTAGNPDFFKGSDNRPVKYDNKYFMMFHNTWPNIANLMRANSDDLEHWNVDGFLLDNRDTPTAGDERSGNADACSIEFKNRTYLFYSWDINDPNVQPYIKYMIDDRPVRELLKLRP